MVSCSGRWAVIRQVFILSQHRQSRTLCSQVEINDSIHRNKAFQSFVHVFTNPYSQGYGIGDQDKTKTETCHKGVRLLPSFIIKELMMRHSHIRPVWEPREHSLLANGFQPTFGHRQPFKDFPPQTITGPLVVQGLLVVQGCLAALLHHKMVTQRPYLCASSSQERLRLIQVLHNVLHLQV